MSFAQVRGLILGIRFVGSHRKLRPVCIVSAPRKRICEHGTYEKKPTPSEGRLNPHDHVSWLRVTGWQTTCARCNCDVFDVSAYFYGDGEESSDRHMRSADEQCDVLLKCPVCEHTEPCRSSVLVEQVRCSNCVDRQKHADCETGCPGQLTCWHAMCICGPT